MRQLKRPRRWAGAAVAAALVLVGGLTAALLHPTGRQLLAWAGRGGGGCPFAAGGGHLSIAAQDAAFVRGAAGQRGSAPARAQPALGLALRGSHRAAFVAWASAAGGRCRDDAAALEVACGDVALGGLPGSGLPGRGTLTAEFDPAGVLRGLKVSAQVRDPGAAAAAVAASRAHLAAQVGVAPEVSGEATAAFLGAGAFRQAAATFRCRDYLATVNATNMGALNYYAVTHTYRAL